MMTFHAGTPDNCIPFFVVDPGTGAPIAPDATPTFAIYRSGDPGGPVEITGVVSSVVQHGVGRYSVVFEAPDYGADGEDPAWMYWIEVDAVVGGVTYSRIIGTFTVTVGNRTYSVVADGANTATSFKTDLTSATNDAYKGALVSWPRDSAFYGQVRKIDAYDGTTKFITLASALTATPSGAFELIVK